MKTNVAVKNWNKAKTDIELLYRMTRELGRSPYLEGFNDVPEFSRVRVSPPLIVLEAVEKPYGNVGRRVRGVRRGYTVARMTWWLDPNTGEPLSREEAVKHNLLNTRVLHEEFRFVEVEERYVRNVDSSHKSSNRFDVRPVDQSLVEGLLEEMFRGAYRVERDDVREKQTKLDEHWGRLARMNEVIEDRFGEEEYEDDIDIESCDSNSDNQ